MTIGAPEGGGSSEYTLGKLFLCFDDVHTVVFSSST